MILPRKLGRVVHRSLTGTYEVTRTEPERSYDAGGVLVVGTFPILLQVPACVQPINGGEVSDLTPEGTTVYAAIDIFTEVRLYAGLPGREADVITVDGFNYDVVSVEDFSALGGFYRAKAVR